MTTINTSSPLASYLASAGKATTATTASSQEKPAESSKDPIAELRSLARQMVARSEGGLLRALNGGGSLHHRPIRLRAHHNTNNRCCFVFLILLLQISQKFFSKDTAMFCECDDSCLFHLILLLPETLW